MPRAAPGTRDRPPPAWACRTCREARAHLCRPALRRAHHVEVEFHGRLGLIEPAAVERLRVAEVAVQRLLESARNLGLIEVESRASELEAIRRRAVGSDDARLHEGAELLYEGVLDD